MEERLLSCSKDWTVLTIGGSDRNNPLHKNYYEIDRIRFDETFIKKLFRKIPTERIQIFLKGSVHPIEFKKYYNEKYFYEYKQELSKFARDNRIKLDDNTLS